MAEATRSDNVDGETGSNSPPNTIPSMGASVYVSLVYFPTSAVSGICFLFCVTAQLVQTNVTNFVTPDLYR
jgi:hypothetical protein